MWADIVNRQEGILNFTTELNTIMAETRLLVLGTGGNGSVLDFLVRTGYQNFEIADFDRVEASNLNRVPFTPDYIGMPKVEAWKKYLATINPQCQVVTHNKRIDKYDYEWMSRIVSRADIVLLNISIADIEAIILASRVCSEQKKRMILGPGTANCWVVTTLAHKNAESIETTGKLGSENIPVDQIDYDAIRPALYSLAAFPGRSERLAPGVAEKVLQDKLAARSAKIFVSMVNAAICWETVKNTILIHNIELKGTQITQWPVLQIFDPWRGAAFYFNLDTKKMGIPNWITGEISWTDWEV
jgi:hypothetical protein